MCGYITSKSQRIKHIWCLLCIDCKTLLEVCEAEIKYFKTNVIVVCFFSFLTFLFFFNMFPLKSAPKTTFRSTIFDFKKKIELVMCFWGNYSSILIDIIFTLQWNARIISLSFFFCISATKHFVTFTTRGQQYPTSMHLGTFSKRKRGEDYSRRTNMVALGRLTTCFRLLRSGF